MNLQQFGQTIKKKYPQYNSLDDVDLAKKVIAKYPSYQNKITEDKSLLEKTSEFVPNVILGGAKGVGSTLAGASSLGERILKGVGRVLTPKSMEKKLGFEKSETGAEALKIQEKLKPTNTAQKIGFGIEQVGEFLVPGGASVKAGTTVAKLLSKSRYANTAKLLTRMGVEAGLVGGQTALQKGEFGKEAKTGAIVGGAFPLAGKVLSTTFKTGGKLLGEALGRTTGAGRYAVEEAFKNPNVIQFARKVGIEGAEKLQTQAANEAKTALNIIKNQRNKEYVSQLEKIKLNKTSLNDIQFNLRDKTKELMGKDKFNIGVKSVDKLGKKINEIDLSGSTITESEVSVKKALEDVFSWTDNTPAGLDVLKKRLGDYISQTKYGTPARNLLTNVRENLDMALKKNIPGYEKMTGAYRNTSVLIEEIEKTLSLGDKKQLDTTIRKLMSTLKQDNELRKSFVKLLSSTGGKDIMGKLAGSSLASAMPKGLAGVLAPTGIAGGTALTILNPSMWPLAITYLSSASPRLVGEFASFLGNATRGADGLIKKTPVVEKTINRIFGEAEKLLK